MGSEMCIRDSTYVFYFTFLFFGVGGVVVGGWFVWFGLVVKVWVGDGEVFRVWIMVFWIVLVEVYEVGKWE